MDLGLDFRFRDLGLRVQVLGFEVWVLWLGYRVRGSGVQVFQFRF